MATSGVADSDDVGRGRGDAFVERVDSDVGRWARSGGGGGDIGCGRGGTGVERVASARRGRAVGLFPYRGVARVCWAGRLDWAGCCYDDMGGVCCYAGLG